MKPEIAKALSDHLDRHNQEKQQAVVRASEREKQIAQNVADFEAAKNAVIEPALQEIVDLYQIKGIAVRVTEQDEIVNRNGGIQPASIGIDMAAVYPHSDMKPHSMLSFDKGNRMLSLHTSTASQAGPAGSVTPPTFVSDHWSDVDSVSQLSNR
jgi:hypothetical protein